MKCACGANIHPDIIKSDDKCANGKFYCYGCMGDDVCGCPNHPNLWSEREQIELDREFIHSRSQL